MGAFKVQDLQIGSVVERVVEEASPRRAQKGACFCVTVSIAISGIIIAREEDVRERSQREAADVGMAYVAPSILYTPSQGYAKMLLCHHSIALLLPTPDTLRDRPQIIHSMLYFLPPLPFFFPPPCALPGPPASTITASSSLDVFLGVEVC